MKKTIVIILIALALTGCETISNYVATSSAVADKASRIKVKAAHAVLCATNYNIARETFGTSDASWKRFVDLCAPTSATTKP